MFWETISALIFLVILSVFWFPLSVVWGIIKFFLTLVFGVIKTFKGSMSEDAFVQLPLRAVIAGFDAFLYSRLDVGLGQVFSSVVGAYYFPCRIRYDEQ